VRRRLTYEEVAARSGVHARTVERLLEGQRFNPETADAIAESLGLPWTSAGENLLEGLALYRLEGSPTWWARVDELADRVERDRTSVQRRIDLAIAVGRLDADQIRREVRRDAIVQPLHNWSPRGCTLVTVRAAVWLLLTTDSGPSQRAQGTVIDECLEWLRQAGVRR